MHSLVGTKIDSLILLYFAVRRYGKAQYYVVSYCDILTEFNWHHYKPLCLNTVYSASCEYNEAQYTVDSAETYTVCQKIIQLVSVRTSSNLHQI